MTRRIKRLLEDVRNKKASISTDSMAEIQSDVDAVRLTEDGEIDLGTCSAKLRSFASSYYRSITETEGEFVSTNKSTEQHAAPTPRQTAELNRELFAHFEEIFSAYTGKSPNNFAQPGEGFDDAIRRLGGELQNKDVREVSKMLDRGQEAAESLREFYRNTETRRIDAASTAAGLKVVLGGKQSFSHSSIRAVRSMALYCDTVLISDPVVRWIESSEGIKKAEKFRHVRMLEDIFYLSRLSPLINADLPYPALIVFPNWDHLLEEKDTVTRDGQELLTLQLFSHCLGEKFEDLDELNEYAGRRPSTFMERIQKAKLFIPLGGTGEEEILDALALQQREWASLRSEEFMDLIDHLTPAQRVLMAVCERMGPQYHILDKAESLNASPLFSLPVHWHYFQLSQKAASSELEAQGVLKSATSKIIQSLNSERFHWLGNVPIDTLSEMRMRGENEKFRSRLRKYADELGNVAEADLDRVAAELGRGLNSMFAEHQADIDAIKQEYAQKHIQSAVGAWITAAASFLPFFPQLTPAVGLAIFGKYAADKASELLKIRQKRRSFIGVLAAAASNAEEE